MGSLNDIYPMIFLLFIFQMKIVCPQWWTFLKRLRSACRRKKNRVARKWVCWSLYDYPFIFNKFLIRCLIWGGYVETLIIKLCSVYHEHKLYKRGIYVSDQIRYLWFQLVNSKFVWGSWSIFESNHENLMDHSWI